MNVSESIDWQHSTPSELFLHRFVAITKSGQTLDGYLSYFPQNGWWILQDADNLTTVIKTGRQRQPHTQHRTLPLHQRAQGDKMKEITLITTDFYISVLGGTR